MKIGIGFNGVGIPLRRAVELAGADFLVCSGLFDYLDDAAAVAVDATSARISALPTTGSQ